MHATQLLDNELYVHCQAIHKTRWAALMATVTALIHGKKLSVTGLGRALQSDAYEKHNIKRADRLIGNPNLNQERGLIYRALAHQVIGQHKQPVILIDWSDLSANRKFHLLRASIAIGRCAFTLYEETHTQAYENNPHVHRRFLKTLKTLLPAQCCPILVSDAGFRTPWFRAVQAMGWDFVGRVGGHTMLSPQSKADWVRVEQIFETATTRPRYLGFIDLVKHNPLPCHAYLVKKTKQGRIKKTKFGTRCMMKHSEKNAHRERTPWLIVTSLPGSTGLTKRVMNLYKTRMQIEEAFRDIKNSRWGFSLDEARVNTTYRYENLLLIGHLASFVIWVMGKTAELQQQHRRYQANSIKSKNVLSVFFLGCRVLQRNGAILHKYEYKKALMELRILMIGQCYV